MDATQQHPDPSLDRRRAASVSGPTHLAQHEQLPTVQTTPIMFKKWEEESFGESSSERVTKKPQGKLIPTPCLYILEERKMPASETTSPQNKNLKKFLAPSVPLPKEKYSLEPDMVFGWKPKFTNGAPIPLKYTDNALDELLSEYYSNPDWFRNHKQMKVVYHGFRPCDSFRMHKRFQGPLTYAFRNATSLFERYEYLQKGSEKDELSTIRPYSGMYAKATTEELHFDSAFEGGNLDTAIKMGEKEYNLYMRSDSNTKGHTSWYYFKVTHGKRGQRVKINIMNFCKSESLYKRGKKPYVYSEKEKSRSGRGWIQSGENITYTSSPQLTREQSSTVHKRRYYKLSFEYVFGYDNDKVSFAMCIPYTYSHLLKFLSETVKAANHRHPEGAIVKSDKLCQDLSGVDVPLLTITEDADNEEDHSFKRVLIVTSRVHPGETNGSWIGEGFLSWICSDDKEAVYLRKRLVIKMVPMLNPDGVIMGNYRTGFAGNDLNRKFLAPSKQLHPTVFAMKKLVEEIQLKRQEIWSYIDLHGHSLKKNVFIYTPQFPVHSPHYYKVKVLPKLVSDLTEMFRFHSCIFRVARGKLTTARAVFSMDYGIHNCYTLEASFAGYLSKSRETVPFNSESLISMGRHLGRGFFTYLKLLEEEEELCRQRKIQRDMQKKLKEKQNCSRSDDLHPDSSMKALALAANRISVNSSSEEDNEAKQTQKSIVNDIQPSKGAKSKRPTATAHDFRRKVRKKPAKAKKQKDKKKREYELDDEDKAGLGIYKILEDIRSEHLNEADKDESDDYGEGGSDSEGSADDFGAEEMQALQSNILNNIKAFNTLPKKKDPRTKIPEKPSSNPHQEDKLVLDKPKTDAKKSTVRPQSSYNRLYKKPQSRSPSRINLSELVNTAKGNSLKIKALKPNYSFTEHGQNYLFRIKKSAEESERAEQRRLQITLEEQSALQENNIVQQSRPFLNQQHQLHSKKDLLEEQQETRPGACVSQNITINFTKSKQIASSQQSQRAEKKTNQMDRNSNSNSSFTSGFPLIRGGAKAYEKLLTELKEINKMRENGQNKRYSNSIGIYHLHCSTNKGKGMSINTVTAVTAKSDRRGNTGLATNINTAAQTTENVNKDAGKVTEALQQVVMSPRSAMNNRFTPSLIDCNANANSNTMVGLSNTTRGKLPGNKLSVQSQDSSHLEKEAAMDKLEHSLTSKLRTQLQQPSQPKKGVTAGRGRSDRRAISSIFQWDPKLTQPPRSYK